MSRTRVTTGAARAVARLAKQVEVAIGPLDLSLPQYRVLALLGDGSTASSVLARKLAVSPPTVTAVVDGLVARGLVERQADPEDRRRLTLLLTRDGKRVLAAADAAAETAPRRDRGVPRRAARRARRRTRQLEPCPRPQPRGAREARLVTIEMGAFGADVSSPFVPVGVTPRYPPPRAPHQARPGRVVAAARSCRWCSRTSGCSASRWSRRSSASRSRCRSRTRSARPSTHWARPRAVARALRGHHRRCSRCIRFVLKYTSRQLPAEDRVPHRVRPAEHHVRAPEPHVVLVLRPRPVGPAHLPRQLRHPLGADVPRVRADHPRAVQRGGPRVRARCCRSTSRSRSSRCRRCRSCYIVGVRMRKQMFPVSWLIQSRLADVATVVDENINGVRVVKSFAAEEHAAQQADRRGAARRVGERQGRRHPGQVVAAASRTCPGSGRRSCCSTAATSPSTGTRRSATSSPSTPTC